MWRHGKARQKCFSWCTQGKICRTGTNGPHRKGAWAQGDAHCNTKVTIERRANVKNNAFRAWCILDRLGSAQRGLAQKPKLRSQAPPAQQFFAQFFAQFCTKQLICRKARSAWRKSCETHEAFLIFLISDVPCISSLFGPWHACKDPSVCSTVLRHKQHVGREAQHLYLQI